MVHVIHFGDGATSSNGFHSGLNFAAVWNVPAVFVCTDNGWAISVPSSSQTASESYAVKGEAYGVPGVTVDGNDVLACRARPWRRPSTGSRRRGPRLVVLRTYRMLGHSSSDDPTKYRSDDEVESWARRDPIERYHAYLSSVASSRTASASRWRRNCSPRSTP